jgi:glutathione synthase/RimK-type ligase-like ATP-grasp enzyme
MVVRWGTTAETGLSSTVTLNKSEAIHRVNDKKGFRLLVESGQGAYFTTTIINSDQPVEPSLFPLVVRTARHAQGRNLWLVNNQEELIQRTSVLGDWYASRFVDKEAEYRVYVANGRVVTVAQKTPADPNQIAWNVAQGGRFDVVRWGLWPLEACRVAIEAFRFSGLDFGGVDVMIEKGTNKPYVLEINSAPSLPSLSNGQVSYRQQVMAKYFKYVLENGNEWIEPLGFSHYKEVIHPCSI